MAGRVCEIWPSLNLVCVPVTPSFWSSSKWNTAAFWTWIVVIGKIVTYLSSGINIKLLQIMIIMPPHSNNGHQCWSRRESTGLPRFLSVSILFIVLPNLGVVFCLLLYCVIISGKRLSLKLGAPEGGLKKSWSLWLMESHMTIIYWIRSSKTARMKTFSGFP